MAIQTTTTIPISIRSASIRDVEDCVRMMWKDVLSKELPQGQSAEELARNVYFLTPFPQLYEINDGNELLAFGLVLNMGQNYHL